MAEKESWHLSKAVPVSLLIGMALQLGMGIWWASTLESRVTEAITQNVQQDVRLHDIEVDAQGQRVAAASVAAQLGAIKESMDQFRTDQRETNDLIRQLIGGAKP